MSARKVIFKINDKEYFKREMNLSEEFAEELFKNMKLFKGTYTLYGSGNNIEKYSLIRDGRKINIHDLNGYEKGVIINDCQSYFEGREFFCNGKNPCGVIEVCDMEKITEHTYGGSSFMKLKLNGKEYEVTAYYREDSTSYKTSADGTEDREKVIAAFNELF